MESFAFFQLYAFRYVPVPQGTFAKKKVINELFTVSSSLAAVVEVSTVQQVKSDYGFRLFIT